MKRKRKLRRNKNFLMLKLLIFVFFGTSCRAFDGKESGKTTIKKCCPKGQELSSSLMCVNATRDLGDNNTNNTGNAGEKMSHFTGNLSKNFENEYNMTEKFSWFPFNSLINASSLQPIADVNQLENFFKNSNFKFGKYPNCFPDEGEWSCFKQKHSEQFRLIFYPDQTIKLYISKKSSYHDEKYFEVENRDCDFSKVDLLKKNNVEKKAIGDSVVESLFKSGELRTFPLEDVCIDRGPERLFLVKFCPCNSMPCVRKCCRDSELFDEVKGKCVSNVNFPNWRPYIENSSLTRDYYLLSKRYPSSCKKPFLLKIPPTPEVDWRPKCGSFEAQANRNKFQFLSDGGLKVKKYKKEIPARSYCGDHVIYNSTVFLENNLLICSEEENLFSKFRIYGVLFIIGGIVLLITILISIYLPQLRASVYSKIIICHNLSLMLSDFLWGSSYLLPFITQNLCIFLSLAIQCTFLGSFFWMNVICLDISLGFRSWKTSKKKSNDKHKFLKYLIYACGAPIIITSITAIMEFAPSLPPNYIRPGFGCYNCGFNPDSQALLIYIYGPMMAIIFFNVLFYIFTIIQILKIQNETAILNCEDSSRKPFKRKKKRFVIFSKLFLFMGLSWIMEIVGWIVGGKDYYWYLPDMINILRAVFIFIIIICKKKIIKSLICKLKNLPETSNKSENRRNTAAEYELEDAKNKIKTAEAYK